MTDEQYQDDVLRRVSRTFALTIPELPDGLRLVVGNAYLLCRIADTIEDEPALSAEEKRHFSQWFIAVVDGRRDADGLASGLAPLLSDATIPAEHELVRNLPRVVRITHAFTPGQRSVLSRCVAVMATGMAEYQAKNDGSGLRDLRELDAYCYYVAGVVGEMLTELFCAYSPEIDEGRAELMALAVSFGQGLQLTNILKDAWEDRGRGACWLPRDVFETVDREVGRDVLALEGRSFNVGLRQLVGVARGHLENALAYTLLVPRRERGIRLFCLWAIGMALLTLRNIDRRPGYRSGQEVKISRRTVGLIVWATRLTSWSNLALRLLFGLATVGLPRAVRPVVPARDGPRPVGSRPAVRSPTGIPGVSPPVEGSALGSSGR